MNDTHVTHDSQNLCTETIEACRSHRLLVKANEERRKNVRRQPLEMRLDIVINNMIINLFTIINTKMHASPSALDSI